MDTLDILLEPLRHSPQLPEAARRLAEICNAENERRQRFYQEMTPDQKIEFIDGEVILHSPAKKRHLDITKWAFKLIDAHVEENELGTVLVEKCLCVFPRNDYEPDIVFFGREKEQAMESDTLKFPPPDLAVEILSASTETRDRGVKKEDYQINGVQEYWIIDPEAETLEQYLPEEGCEYRLTMKSSTGEVESPALGGLRLPVPALFDRAANRAALRDILAGTGGSS